MRINLLHDRGVFKPSDNFNLKLGIVIVVTLSLVLILHFSLVKKISDNLTKINYFEKKLIELDKIKQLAIKAKENLVLQRFSELRSKRIDFLKKLNLVYQGVVGSVYLDQISINRNGNIVVVGNSRSIINLRSFIANLSLREVSGNLVVKKIKKFENGCQFMLMW